MSEDAARFFRFWFEVGWELTNDPSVNIRKLFDEIDFPLPKGKGEPGLNLATSYLFCLRHWLFVNTVRSLFGAARRFSE